jgi:broad specificity phosphatase PhoE
MPELILARHAESTASRDGIVNGDPAALVDLTPEGEAQGRRLGELLRDRRIELSVSSEFLRTRRTAELALEGRAVPHLVLPELNDMLFGELEGVSLHSYRSWFLREGDMVAPPGGETRRATVARFARALRILHARPEAAFAVTHGLTIAYGVEAARGGDLDRPPAPPPYATPEILSAAEVEIAAARLERWATGRSVRCTSN